LTLAELLGVASATFARRLSLRAGGVSIERQTDAGYDTVECELPALVALTAGAAEVRHPSLKDSIEAKKKPLGIVGDTLTVIPALIAELEQARVGAAGGH
jgi:electron transfer flavoprotein alpha/beta subunit